MEGLVGCVSRICYNEVYSHGVLCYCHTTHLILILDLREIKWCINRVCCVVLCCVAVIRYCHMTHLILDRRETSCLAIEVTNTTHNEAYSTLSVSTCACTACRRVAAESHRANERIRDSVPRLT